MLKRFLQLFRNENDPSETVEHPHRDALDTVEEAETTYLEFLFESVRPRVKERLEEYPESDPVLELATGILIEMFPDYWDEPDGAITDQWSPMTPATPPPPPQRADGAAGPPPAPPAPESTPQATEAKPDQDSDDEPMDSDPEVVEETDDTDDEAAENVEADDEDVKEVDADDEDVEEVEADDEDVEEVDADDEDVEEVDADDEDVKEVEADDEDVEEVDVDEPSVDAPGGDDDDPDHGSDVDEQQVHDVDELDAVEERSAEADAAPPAGFASTLDDTAEFEPPPVRRGKKDKSIWPVAVDDPSVLRGSRMLLSVLVDNDRLPVDEQLDVSEMLMAADLWVHLMVQATSLDEKAQNLARLVEQKFEANRFSQARLLLELFPANHQTRIKHDRQLFYEGMILRLGMHRDSSAPVSGVEATASRLDGLELSDDAEVRRTLRTLNEETGVAMHVYTREPSNVDRWREIAELCQWSSAPSYVLGRIPPRRWRPGFAHRERSLRTMLREHIVLPMARDQVISYIKACYFVLRAVGDTGLEPYLDCFFEWSDDVCGVDATTFLPAMHQRIQGDAEMIDDVFDDIYERHYRQALANTMEAFDDEALDESFAQAMEWIAGGDFDEIPRGHFDLGAFVLEAYLDIELPSPEFSFKLYRLT